MNAEFVLVIAIIKMIRSIMYRLSIQLASACIRTSGLLVLKTGEGVAVHATVRQYACNTPWNWRGDVMLLASGGRRFQTRAPKRDTG